MSMQPFSHQYETLLMKLMSIGHEDMNARTGHRVRALPPQSLSIDLADGRMPLTGTRRLFPRTAAAEVAWFLSGRKDLEWLRKYCKIWDKFTEPDGTVDSAYGYRMRNHFGRDQLSMAVQALIQDPSDRRVYVSYWDPSSDGLGVQGQKNVPCPVGFTLSILDGCLNSQLSIRSSDVFVGLPYDVMGHVLLMRAVASTISLVKLDRLRLGRLQVSLAHPHIYDSHYAMAMECLGSVPSRESFDLPEAWPIGRIVSQPDGYVAAIAERGKLVEWPEYNPLPEVIQ